MAVTPKDVQAIPTANLAIARNSVTSYYKSNIQTFSQNLRKNSPACS
ncbi:MAG: hypothetical protein PUP90_00290 [Nostoc sp. S4]|nr:hypothetical protein [Nostoc sp. S4]